MLHLSETSGVDEVMAAMAEAGMKVPDLGEEFRGERLVSDVAVSYRELPGEPAGGIFDDASRQVRAWTLSWTRLSWSRGTEVRRGLALIELEEGGLAPDGGWSATRYALGTADPEKVDLAMRCVAAGCVPVAKLSDGV